MVLGAAVVAFISYTLLHQPWRLDLRCLGLCLGGLNTL